MTGCLVCESRGLIVCGYCGDSYCERHTTLSLEAHIDVCVECRTTVACVPEAYR